MEENKNIDELSEEQDIITLMTNDGEEEEFFHVATIDYKNEWYAFLHPVEKSEDIAEDEAIIFLIKEDKEGNDSFIPVDDEKLIDAVYAEYVKEVEKMENEQA